MKAQGGSSAFVISDVIRLLTADGDKKVAGQGAQPSPWLTANRDSCPGVSGSARCGMGRWSSGEPVLGVSFAPLMAHPSIVQYP